MVSNGLEDTNINPFDHPTISMISFAVCKMIVVILMAVQTLVLLHSCLQELCKEHFIYEDYTGDFHIRTLYLVAGIVKDTSSMGVKGDASDGSIPQWAKVLDPVKKLPTNVGSCIRNCVYEALNNNPPEWARVQLEASISKGFYKGNTSWPTKRAVIDVLKRAASNLPQRPSSLDVNASRSSCELLISKAIMKKCRSVLRHVAATYDNQINFSILAGNLKSDEMKVVFESSSKAAYGFSNCRFKIA